MRERTVIGGGGWGEIGAVKFHPSSIFFSFYLIVTFFSSIIVVAFWFFCCLGYVLFLGSFFVSYFKRGQRPVQCVFT